jgi:hypothetical protein
MSKIYGCSPDQLGHYTVHRTKTPILINGKLDHPAWRNAPESPRFVDMVSGQPGFFDTRMAALWDKDFFYLGFWIQEPNVTALITERDGFIYNENDVELFIEGEDCYYEFQINARGTIYEVFYIWQTAYTKNSRFNCPQFDLIDRDVDVLGGFQDISRHQKHPKGKRWAIMDWDLPGLQTAVFVDGLINDPSSIDRGWRVELAFPWSGMKALAPSKNLPPKDGDIWRMDFSRFELLKYNGTKAEPHPGWSFNQHGIYDSHIPEVFTYVHFSEQQAQPLK